METLLETVRGFFEGREWRFEEVEGRPVLRTGVTCEHGSYACVVIADQRTGLLAFHSYAPDKVPEDRRAKVAEFLTRLNWHVWIGSFGMDYGDGEVQRRTSVDVSGDRLSDALVDNVIRANLVGMDQVWPFLRAVMTTDLSPADACEMLQTPKGMLQ